MLPRCRLPICRRLRLSPPACRAQHPPRPLAATSHAGTSRRFGFAKFAERGAAEAALEALRGTLLHGAQGLKLGRLDSGC